MYLWFCGWRHVVTRWALMREINSRNYCNDKDHQVYLSWVKSIMYDYLVDLGHKMIACVSAGDAPCEEYSATCDVTSGFRCVRFNDVTTESADGVQCVCLVGPLDRCLPTNDSAPATGDVLADVTDDDDDDVDTGGHSRWLLTRRHTNRLIGELVESFSVTLRAEKSIHVDA